MAGGAAAAVPAIKPFSGNLKAGCSVRMVGMNKPWSAPFGVLLLLLLLVWSACDDSSSDDAAAPQTEDSQPITFPVQDPTNDVMQALIEGTLTVRERCLYLSVGEPYDLVLPIWPNGFSYERADGKVSVLDANAETVAQTGSPMSMGGGMFGETDDSPLPAELQERVGPCEGPYWIVGEMAEPP